MGEFAIGQSVLRREDSRLLTGNGRYFDDLKLADQLFAAIVRFAARACRHPWHRRG
jgi:CO/xanthine dehydrogenase Mo-binding subunit